MPAAPLRLVRHCFELAPKEDLEKVPNYSRGMYVLYKHTSRTRPLPSGKPRFDVVYVGISGRRLKSRLRQHSRTKADAWTQFSVLEVHDNIRSDELKELEGLFRHIYRFDAHANQLNLAKGYQTLIRVRAETMKEGWMQGVTPAIQLRGAGRAQSTRRRRRRVTARR
jgi:hypothetical protein